MRYRHLVSLLSFAALALPGACTRERATSASVLVDAFGDTLVANAHPVRIVSLNPTTTELLFAIGAGSRVVGRTSYDLYPDAVRAIPDLGPGLRPNVEAVLAARPDLVILYAGADNRDAARRLIASGVRTAAFRVDRIADFDRVTRQLGILIGDTVAAQHTVDSVHATLARIRTATSTLPHPSVMWPLWQSPLLVAGGGSFLTEIVDVAGGRNVFADLAAPSPAVSMEEVIRRDPDVILTSSEGRVHMLADPRWQVLRAVRERKLLVVDTAIVNGPSPRVGASAEAIARLLHPGMRF